jgi:hypothetical protein
LLKFSWAGAKRTDRVEEEAACREGLFFMKYINGYSMRVGHKTQQVKLLSI